MVRSPEAARGCTGGSRSQSRRSDGLSRCAAPPPVEVVVGRAGGCGPRGPISPVGGSCPGGETCPTDASPLGTVASHSPLKVIYTAPSSHCSDVAVKIFEDGHQVGITGFASPSQSSASVSVPWPTNGTPHELGFEGLGKVGGCNAGSLVLWSGTLTVTYKSRKPSDKVTLSGIVLRHRCEELGSKKCVLAGEPFPGRAVQVVGSRKRTTRRPTPTATGR